jgi:hypothetical protein
MQLLMELLRFLDTLHTCLVMASVWNYLIPHYGDVPRVDFIPWYVRVYEQKVKVVMIYCVTGLSAYVNQNIYD